jgi:hypothetical protein
LSWFEFLDATGVLSETNQAGIFTVRPSSIV